MADLSNDFISRLGRLITLSVARLRCEYLEDHDYAKCTLCENVRQELSNIATKMADSADKDVAPIWKLCSFNAINLANQDVRFSDTFEFLGIDSLAIQTSDSFQALIKQRSGKDFFEFADIAKTHLRSCEISDWKTALAEVILAFESTQEETETEAFLLDAAEALATRLDEAGLHTWGAFCFMFSWSYSAAAKCLKKHKTVSNDEFLTFVAFVNCLSPETKIDDESVPALAARLIGMGKPGLAKDILDIYAPTSEQLVAEAFGGLAGENKDSEQHVNFACGLLRLGKVKQAVCDMLLQMCRAIIDADFNTALAICSKVQDVAGGFVDEESFVPVDQLFGPFKEMLREEI